MGYGGRTVGHEAHEVLTLRTEHEHVAQQVLEANHQCRAQLHTSLEYTHGQQARTSCIKASAEQQTASAQSSCTTSPSSAARSAARARLARQGHIPRHTVEPLEHGSKVACHKAQALRHGAQLIAVDVEHTVERFVHALLELDKVLAT